MTPYLPEAETNYDRVQRVLVGHLLLFPSAASDVFAMVTKERSAAFKVPALQSFLLRWASALDSPRRVGHSLEKNSVDPSSPQGLEQLEQQGAPQACPCCHKLIDVPLL